MISVKDPLTGSTIRWSSHPQALGYALPLSAAVNPRVLVRQWSTSLHPTVATTYGTRICLGMTGWPISLQLHRFDAATLTWVDMINMGQQATTINGWLIPAWDRVPIIATSPPQASTRRLYWVCDTGLQGAIGSWYLRRLDTPTGNWVSLPGFAQGTASNWVGGSIPQVDGSNVARAYTHSIGVLSMDASTDRVLVAGRIGTANGRDHAGVLYSDDLASATASVASTWRSSPVVFSPTGADLHSGHMAVWNSEDMASNMVILAITGHYRNDFVNIVYNENGGADGSWKIAAADAGTDYPVPVGGISSADAEFTGRRLAALNDNTKYYVGHRLIYDATTETAWLSMLVGVGTDDQFLNSSPAGRPTGTQSIYLLKIDMSNRATTGTRQTLYGPFLTDKRHAANGMDIALDPNDATRLIGVVARPYRFAGPDPNYHDYPRGGDALLVYGIPKATAGTFETWTLLNTIARPGGGSPYLYIDSEPILTHEFGIGHGQLFCGHRIVDGSNPLVIAASLSDQRVTGSDPLFQIARPILVPAIEV